MHEQNRRDDRRVRKTRALLHEALASLIVEKSYDTISLQQLLERANVGRSTFYTHFRNIDELLTESIHEMLRSVQPATAPRSGKWHDRITWFSLPIFEHHDRHRRTREAKMGARGRAILHEHLQKVHAESILDALMKDRSDYQRGAAQTPAQLLALYLASTFVLVLNWWIESRKPLPAEKVNEMYRALVVPTLSAFRF
jgi:AcrR family transcriptional regulator